MVSATPDIVANIARSWNRDPASVALGTERQGLSAALWTHHGEEAVEVGATPDPDRHILALVRRHCTADLEVDRRLRVVGRCVPTGSVQCVRAGERPKGVIYGSFEVLHLYLPTSLITGFAESGLTGSDRIELIDPVYALDGVIERIGHEVVAEMRENLPLSRLRIDALGQDLAVHLIRRWSNLRGMNPRDAGTARGGLAPHLVRRVTDYIGARLAEDVGLADVAAVAGLSPSHFTYAFRRSFGVPPHTWLVRKRVERAQELLAHTDVSVLEVALACGFSHGQHLARVFRRRLGATPTEYRRQRRA